MKKVKASSARVYSEYASASVDDIFSAFQSGQPSNDLPVAQVDSQALAALKSLSKREARTRAKALQDLLNNIIPSLDHAGALAYLPHFVGAYSRYALLDADWKSRSLYHNCIAKLYSCLGRSIEPFLGDIIPTLVLGKHDVAARESQQAAIRCLEHMFLTPEKEDRIMKHFSSLIVESIHQYFKSTPESLSKVFTCQSIAESGELGFEATDRWERVLCACFLSLEYHCRLMGADFHQQLTALDPLRFLQSSHTSHASVTTACIRFASFCMKTYSTLPVAPSMYQDIANNVVDIQVNETSAGGSVEGWELLSMLSESSHSIKLNKLALFLESTEVRSLSTEAVQTIAMVAKSAPIAGKGRIQSALVEKLKAAMALDHRVRHKYVSLLSVIVECAISGSDSTAATVCRLLEVTRHDQSLRTVVASIARSSRVALTPSELDASRVGVGAVIALLWGSSSEECGESIGLLVEDFAEVSFALNVISADNSLDQALIETLSKSEFSRIQEWIDSGSPLSDVFAVLNRLLSATAEADVRDILRKMSFHLVTKFVTSPLSAESGWINAISANPELMRSTDWTLHENQSALIDAVSFVREVSTTRSEDGCIDNGLILFGHTDFNDIVYDISTTHANSSLANELLSSLLQRRKETGTPVYFPDELILRIWATAISTNPPITILPVILDCVEQFRDSLFEPSQSAFAQSIVAATSNPESDDLILSTLISAESDRRSFVKAVLESGADAGCGDRILHFIERLKSFDKEFVQLVCALWTTDITASIRERVISHWHSLEWENLTTVVYEIFRVGFTSSEDPSALSDLFHLVAGPSEGRKKLGEVGKCDFAVDSLVNWIEAVPSDTFRQVWSLFCVSSVLSPSSKSLCEADRLRMKDALSKWNSENCGDVVVQVKWALKALLISLGESCADELGLSEFQFRASEYVGMNRFQEKSFAIVASLGSDSVADWRGKLRHVDCYEVVDLLLSDPSEIESCFERYLKSGLDFSEIDPRVMEYLQEHGSLQFALACLDHHKIEAAMGRIRKLEMSDFPTTGV